MSNTLELLSDILGVSDPVSFETFVVSPDYCNNQEIYPFWLNSFPTRESISMNELLLGGSLGNGKTTCASYVIAYRVYLLFFYGSPQRQLGLPDDADIYGLYFSVSLKMAQKSGFKSLYSIFEKCKWFVDNAPINTEKQSSIEFIGKHFTIDYASGECVSPDSYIFTATGIVRADELKEGDLVWTGNEYLPVEHVSTGESQFVDVLDSVGTTHSVTENHKFYTDRGFVHAIDLKPGDKIFYNQHTLNNNAPFKVYLFPEFPNDRNKSISGQCVLDTEFAEVLGWLTGDGSFCDYTHGVRWIFSSEENYLAERYRSVLSKYWNVAPCVTSKNNITEFVLKSKSAYWLFDEQLGLMHRAPEKRVPKIIFESSTEVMGAYLRGLFSADGSMKKGHKNDGVIKKFACRLCSSSRGLLDDCKALLHYMGINSSITKSQTKWLLTVSFVSLPKFKELIGFSVTAKQELLEQCIRPAHNRYNPTVVSVTPTVVKTCYGADVEGGIYTVNGMITHNTHQIGLNVYLFILDEANFRQGVGLGTAEQYQEVTNLYQQLLDRQLSRFARPDGTVDALAVLISSASYQSSFFEQRKAAIKGLPGCRVIESAAYEVKPWRFSKETFEVFIGSGLVEPCIIESEEQKLRVFQAANLLGTGQEEDYIKKVPVNLLASFKANTPLALQNHAGISTNVSSSFMSNLKYLFDSYKEILCPFQSEFLEAPTGTDTQLIEYLLPELIEYPERPHSMFLDLSIASDAGALCCFRYDGKDERGYDIHTRVFSLHIIPPPFPAQTSVTKVKQFIIDLASRFNLVAFGSDQYQCLSGDTLIPTERGILRLDQIVSGDFVFGPSGRVRVNKVFVYENAPTIKVTTNHKHTFISTPNHRMVEEFPSTVNNVPQRKKRLTEVKDLMGKWLSVTKCVPTNSEYQSIGQSLLTEELALVLGWMTGDGGVTGGYPYLLANSDELELVQNIMYGICDKTYDFSNQKDRSSFSFRLSRKWQITHDILSVYGNHCSAFEKFVPECILKSPKSVIAAYLRGLFSSDGSCTHQQVVLSSVNKHLLESVRMLLQTYFGVLSTITEGKRGYEGDYKQDNSEWHLRSFGKVSAFSEIGFLQSYKMELFKQACSVVGKGFREYPISIEDNGRQTVFDLEVDSEDHLYYTTEFLTHNSTGLRQDVCEELNLQDIRISVDSSDIPHLHWQRALVDGRIKQSKDDYLAREVREAIHDHKRHRVVKAKKSSDDCLQANVAAFYLSDTEGKQQGTIENLYGQRANLVGGKSIKQVLRTLGYQ